MSNIFIDTMTNLPDYLGTGLLKGNIIEQIIKLIQRLHKLVLIFAYSFCIIEKRAKKRLTDKLNMTDVDTGDKLYDLTCFGIAKHIEDIRQGQKDRYI